VSVTSQARNFAPEGAPVVVATPVDVVEPPAAVVVVLLEELDPHAASTLAATIETATPANVLR
jgi:hypothetical protein